MIKILNVDANSVSTSLGDIIRRISLLGTTHIITHLYHANQRLSKTDATMSTILQAANQVASLLLTNLIVLLDAHAYWNLEDKVLFGVGVLL